MVHLTARLTARKIHFNTNCPLKQLFLTFFTPVKDDFKRYSAFSSEKMQNRLSQAGGLRYSIFYAVKNILVCGKRGKLFADDKLGFVSDRTQRFHIF